MSYVAPSGNDVRFVFRPGLYIPPAGNTIGFVFDDVVGVAGVGAGVILLTGSGLGAHTEPIIGSVSTDIGLAAGGVGLSTMLLGNASAVIGLTGYGSGVHAVPVIGSCATTIGLAANGSGAHVACISGSASAGIGLNANAHGGAGECGVATASLSLTGRGFGGRGSVLAGSGAIVLSATGRGAVGCRGVVAAYIELSARGECTTYPSIYGPAAAAIPLFGVGYGAAQKLSDGVDGVDTWFVRSRRNRIEVVL